MTLQDPFLNNLLLVIFKLLVSFTNFIYKNFEVLSHLTWKILTKFALKSSLNLNTESTRSKNLVQNEEFP